MKDILIISPHLDDDVLGCGGCMYKYSQLGYNVYVAFITNGNIGAPELFSLEGTIRGREEALSSHKVLGIKETFFYDFPAPRLDDFPSYKISLVLNELIKKLRADTIFIPFRGDIHNDHTVVFNSALVAARPVDNCPVKTILAYETLSETEWAPPFGNDTFCPNIFMQLSDGELDKKIEAFSCYSPPRIKEHPHPRSVAGIRTLAKFRGMNVNKQYAESYVLIRNIKD